MPISGPAHAPPELFQAGPAFRVTRQRGEVMASPFGIPIMATVHPSSILRAADDAAREAAMASFAADLRVAARQL